MLNWHEFFTEQCSYIKETFIHKEIASTQFNIFDDNANFSYAFGITMWECFTSQRPYPGVPRALLGHSVVMGKRPEFPYGAPVGYKSLAEACWQHTAADRPTFKEVTEALARLIRLEPGRTSRIRVSCQ